MARAHEIGTPEGAERKSRRVSSPLQEMDDAFEEEGTWTNQLRLDAEPQTPTTARRELTLEAIEGLMARQVAPVLTSVEGLEKQMQDISLSVEKRLSRNDKRLEDIDLRIAKLERSPSTDTMPEHAKEIQTQLKEMEQQIAELRGVGIQPPTWDDTRAKTAVLGGLGSMSSVDDAWTWLSNKMWTLYGPKPTEVYSKGEFRGIVFAKFDDKAARDTAVKLLRQSASREGGNAVWAKPDQALHQRVLLRARVPMF